MSEEPLVSIIIPTFNRAHLIGETLDSVSAQTYQNWECIVVDDGSTDDTDAVMKGYCDKDSRFKYYHRPEEHLPGGNGARNYGFKMSQGEYIQWFDSDDLMTENHIQVKYDLIKSGEYDFGLSRTRFFNYPNGENYKNDKFYAFDQYEINVDNYLLQKINWLTPDLIVKKDIIIDICFDENLKCAQEYNFHSKLLCLTSKTVYSKEYISLRRYDNTSISESVRKKSHCKLVSHWKTFIQTKHKSSLSSKNKMINDIYKTVISIDNIPSEISTFQLVENILKYGKNKIFKIIYLPIFSFTNRFHFLRKLALNEK